MSAAVVAAERLTSRCAVVASGDRVSARSSGSRESTPFGADKIPRRVACAPARTGGRGGVMFSARHHELG